MFDFKRIFTGLIIVAAVFFSYYLNYDILLISSIVVLILYELFRSNIINKNLNFFFLILIFLFNILIFYYELIFINYIILFILILLSLIHKNNINLYFSSTILLLIILFIDVNLLSRQTFYLIFLISFINDTFALITGKTFKGPYIVPKISPNKTWSGTLSSIILSFLILNILEFKVVFSIIVSLSFFFSDIYFSYIKRSNNLKDFSKILGSHGGILDRLDSILIPSSIFLFSIYFL